MSDSSTKIQAVWRGYKVRKNVKVFDGCGELPNYENVITWQHFKVEWVNEGKIPIYRLSEYTRKLYNELDKKRFNNPNFGGCGCEYCR